MAVRPGHPYRDFSFVPGLTLKLAEAEDGKEVINAIHHAIDAGYRHVDTASFYQNEEGVGKAVKTILPTSSIAQVFS